MVPMGSGKINYRLKASCVLCNILHVCSLPLVSSSMFKRILLSYTLYVGLHA